MKTVEEIRRDRLLELKAQHGSFAKLNELLGRLSTDSTFSQIANSSLNSKTKTPKVMGSDQARKIEELLKKPRGWMDNDAELLRAAITVERVASLPVPAQPGIHYLATALADRLQPLTPNQRISAGNSLNLIALEPENAAPFIASLAGLLGEDIEAAAPYKAKTG